MAADTTQRRLGRGARFVMAALLALATTTVVAVGIALAQEEDLDPARNLTLPCGLIPEPASPLVRSKKNIEHIAHKCGVVGTDIEFQSRIRTNGARGDYAVVGTMGAGFQIYNVTNPLAPTAAGGFTDSGWQNDIQITDQYAVSTFDGVSGEDSTASTCLKQGAWSGQGIDIVKLNFDPATGTYGPSLLTCVPNPPGGAHNATISPNGKWLVISNCCSDWALDVVDLTKLPASCNPVTLPSPLPPLATCEATPEAHVYRLIDASRATNVTKCVPPALTAPASGAPCIVMTRPDGSSASGLWDPHDVHFSADGETMYVAAINSTFIVDSGALLDANGEVQSGVTSVPTLAIIPNGDGVPGDTANDISISHQADITPDGKILVVSDERGGGLNNTSCNTSETGIVGALHFWALAPIDGQPSTALASVATPVKLGIWVNPNPGDVATDPLEGLIVPALRTQRGCTVHVFRIGGNGSMSPGQGGNLDGISALGSRQLVTAFYGAGVWHVDFAGPPNDGDGTTEDDNTTWGNTLGWNIQPGADTWSAKEYRGFIFAGDMIRGFDVYGCSREGLTGSCIQDPAVAMTMNGPVTANPGATIEYTLTYRNAGPASSVDAKIADTLPKHVTFVSASNGGKYDAQNRRVVWKLGTVPVGPTGTVTLRVKIPATTATPTVLLNQAEFTGEMTVSPPTAKWSTTVLQ